MKMKMQMYFTFGNKSNGDFIFPGFEVEDGAEFFGAFVFILLLTLCIELFGRTIDTFL